MRKARPAKPKVWIEFAHKCHYVDDATRDDLDKVYDQILSQLVRIIDEADKWLIR